MAPAPHVSFPAAHEGGPLIPPHWQTTSSSCCPPSQDSALPTPTFPILVSGSSFLAIAQVENIAVILNNSLCLTARVAPLRKSWWLKRQNTSRPSPLLTTRLRDSLRSQLLPPESLGPPHPYSYLPPTLFSTQQPQDPHKRSIDSCHSSAHKTPTGLHPSPNITMASKALCDLPAPAVCHMSCSPLTTLLAPHRQPVAPP